ncbi:hypothetical protein [Chitinophaga sp. Ak27]|uniref:hypothetical protein n=1 Tax=Chitinophaga sp. Ak27 TaxID=2726116 RepID=UPI00145DC137|nr:hypothetical protein [Chitinophaga sp. Ak27]NLU91411.1 hypothetical protein [Chitinophaga sp. Ak27]
MRVKYNIFLLFFIISTASCSNRTQHADINTLIRKYSESPEDSFRLEAALFFKEQLKQQTSVRNVFYDEVANETVKVSLDTIDLPSFLIKNGLSIRKELLPDSSIFSDSLLETHIDSYNFYMKTWAWNHNVDKNILHNYLLAYKIYQEESQNWRTFFFREQERLLKEVLAAYKLEQHSNNENLMTVTLKLLSMAENWYAFDNIPLEHYGSMSFDMMKCLRKGDCYFGAYTAVYMLRSFGIPAALDYVPFWGSKNGGHAEVAALDSTGRINAIPGHELKHAAKVFRISFIPTNTWRDSIRPYMGNDSFLLPGIAHDHWLDVTAVHTDVADINFILPQRTEKKIAYICAFNVGGWTPVYWGNILQGTEVRIKQMGKNILYHVALPDGDGFRLTGRPFLLDMAGRQIYFSADKRVLLEMKLSKLNTGSESWVKIGKEYTLYFIDNDGEWQKVSDIVSVRDSVLPVEKVPSGGIYRLVEKGRNERLARPFRYIDNQQVWL